MTKKNYTYHIFIPHRETMLTQSESVNFPKILNATILLLLAELVCINGSNNFITQLIFSYNNKKKHTSTHRNNNNDVRAFMRV